MLKCLNVKMTKRGFTMIEIIIAILVVTVGVLAAYIVTQKIVSYTCQISSRLTAAYLAKEGIEIVRNVRDTNWIDSTDPPWDDDLAVGDWEVAYNDQILTSCSSPCNPDHNLRFLKISGGFYCYSGTNDTKFKRKITISDVGSDNLTVSVSVWWEEKGKTYGPITAQEILYDWY